MGHCVLFFSRPHNSIRWLAGVLSPPIWDNHPIFMLVTIFETTSWLVDHTMISCRSSFGSSPRVRGWYLHAWTCDLWTPPLWTNQWTASHGFVDRVPHGTPKCPGRSSNYLSQNCHNWGRVQSPFQTHPHHGVLPHMRGSHRCLKPDDFNIDSPPIVTTIHFMRSLWAPYNFPRLA